MTPKKTYVSVILPLKLDWMPCYSLPEGTNARPGDWVKVVFANRTYSGIIAKYDIIPDTEPSKIKDVAGVCTNLSPVTAEEIRLWEMVADYYLCSIGEVFKAAYPALKISQEETLARMQEREREKRELALHGGESLMERKQHAAVILNHVAPEVVVLVHEELVELFERFCG